MTRILPSETDSLWTLFTAPVIWAVHFLACYVLVAVHCQKPGVLGIGFSSVRLIIAATTMAALIGILLSAWLAWRQWGYGRDDPPHDDPTLRDRTLFQGFATLLLSGLSFVAVVLVAMPVLFISECLR